MRTTLDIDETLLIRARTVAARERTTLTRLIEEGLRLRLQDAPRTPETAEPFRMPVYRGHGGLAPGIDPCSNRSMFDAADEEDVASGPIR